jgi:putative membrane protein
MLIHAYTFVAHDGAHHSGEGPWWTLWNLRIEMIACLTLLTWAYWLGVRRLWASAGRGRGVSVRQTWAFYAGIGALVLALVSPIDIIAEELNAVHMVQHMLLIMVAAPLLVIGSTLTVLLWSLPATARNRFGAWTHPLRQWRLQGYMLWQPILTWTLFALVLWMLHLPKLYSAALQDRFLHDLQHIAFLAVACVFWRVLLDPISRQRLSPGIGVLYLFTTTLHASALGVFMAFSPRLWYDDYAETTAAWGISALEDQQLAGYIMWMPACLLYAVAAAVIFGLWLRSDWPEEPRRVRDVTDR